MKNYILNLSFLKWDNLLHNSGYYYTKPYLYCICSFPCKVGVFYFTSSSEQIYVSVWTLIRIEDLGFSLRFEQWERAAIWLFWCGEELRGDGKRINGIISSMTNFHSCFEIWQSCVYLWTPLYYLCVRWPKQITNSILFHTAYKPTDLTLQVYIRFLDVGRETQT